MFQPRTFSNWSQKQGEIHRKEFLLLCDQKWSNVLPYLIKKKVAFSNDPFSCASGRQWSHFLSNVNLSLGSQLFGFAVLMLFNFLKSFQNMPFCTITCKKDFDKISGTLRFQACQLENSLKIGERKNLVLIMMWLFFAAAIDSGAMLHYKWASILNLNALCSLLVSSLFACFNVQTNRHLLFVCILRRVFKYLSLVSAFTQSGLCRPVHRKLW